MNFAKNFVMIFAVILLLVTPLSAPTHADDSSDFSKKCGFSLNNPAPQGAADKLSGTTEACTNAQASYKTWKTAEPVGAAWTAVAGVCLSACIAAIASAHTADFVLTTLCTVGDLGTTIYDTVSSNDLSSALTGLVMPLAGAVSSFAGVKESYKKLKESKAAKGNNAAEAKGENAAVDDAAKKATDEATQEAKSKGAAVSQDTEKGLAEAGKDATQDGEKAASKMDKIKAGVACFIPVAMASLQAATKFVTANTAKQAFSNQLTAINPADTTGGTGITLTGPQTGVNGGNGSNGSQGGNLTGQILTSAGISGSGLNASTGGSGNSPTSNVNSDSSANSGGPCSSTGTSGSSAEAPGGKIMACAIALDSTLPPVLGTAAFADAFQKNTGKDLSTFMAATQGMAPKDAILAAVAGTNVPASLSAALSSMMDGTQALGSKYAGNASSSGQAQAKADLAQPLEVIDSTLTGGGGGRAVMDPNADAPPFDSMMQNLLSKFMPTTGKPTEKDKAIATIIFANQKFSPASLAENRKLNIFDRVTYRYLVLGKGWYPNAALNSPFRP